MKTAIIYYSKHHGNTKKLLDAIASQNEVTLIDAANESTKDLSSYDRVGLASGIYFNNFAKQVVNYANESLPIGKEVFYIYTAGAANGNFLKNIRKVVEEKGCTEIGDYHCQGFDTFGPLKLIGGHAKGHPTNEEIQAAVSFYENL